MHKNLLFSIFILHFVAFFYILSILPDFLCSLGVLCSFILSFSIFFFVLFRNHIDIFEPIVLFSLYNILTPLVQLYLVFDYQNNVFLKAQPLTNSFSTVFNLTAFLNLIGYYACIIGNSFSKKIPNGKINFYSPSKGLVRLFIPIMVFVALCNFLYNMLFVSGNLFLNPVNIYTNVSKLKEQGTTIFYNLAYFALFLYLAEEKNRNYKKDFAIVLIVFLMQISNLRITLSLMVLLTYVGVQYEDSNYRKKNILCFVALVFLFLFGFFIYFLRISMSLVLMGKEVNFSNLIKNFFYFAIHKGNVPNIAIQMFLYDKWENLLFGKTFFSPFLIFLPGIDASDLMPAVIIKNNYFMSVQSGALPVTGIGEFYMNLSYPCIVVGMFIFGFLGSIIYNKMYKSSKRILKIIGINIAISFYMLFPKGEINNLDLFKPICMTMLYLLFDFLYQSRYKIPKKIENKAIS